MPEVTVVTGGDGGFSTQRVEIPHVPIQFRIGEYTEDGEVFNGSRFVPAIVRNVEIENDAEEERITDQCGRTENRRHGDKNWSAKIDCIVTPTDTIRRITEDESRAQVRNLSLRRVKELKGEDVVQLEGGVFEEITGTFEISNVLITQSNDFVYVNVGDGDELAYEVQIQAKQAQPE